MRKAVQTWKSKFYHCCLQAKERQCSTLYYITRTIFFLLVHTQYLCSFWPLTPLAKLIKFARSTVSSSSVCCGSLFCTPSRKEKNSSEEMDQEKRGKIALLILFCLPTVFYYRYFSLCWLQNPLFVFLLRFSCQLSITVTNFLLMGSDGILAEKVESLRVFEARKIFG